MMRKRLLSLTLSAVMTLSLFPTHALAAEAAPPDEALPLVEMTELSSEAAPSLMAGETRYTYHYSGYTHVGHEYDGHPPTIREEKIEVRTRDGSPAPTWQELKDSGTVRFVWFDCNEDPLNPTRLEQPPVEPGSYQVHVEESWDTGTSITKLSDAYIALGDVGRPDYGYFEHPCTFEYTGPTTKLYDGQQAVFDTDQLVITDKETQTAKTWAEVSAPVEEYDGTYELRVVWTAGHNSLAGAPSLPGEYQVVIQKQDTVNSWRSYDVAGFSFTILPTAQPGADGTYQLPLKGYRGNQLNNPPEVDAGILTITADGTITGLDQSQMNPFDIKNITIPIPEEVSVDGNTITIHAIGEKAFYNKAYQEIIIPKTVSSIGERAFDMASYCERITVDPGNRWFRHWEWKNELGLNSYQCRALYSRDLSTLLCVPCGAGGDFTDALRVYDRDVSHQPLREIGPYAMDNVALYESSSDGKFVLPDTVTKVSACAFLNFRGAMNQLFIGSGLTELEVSAMFGYALPDGLNSITVSPDNQVYSSANGLLLNKDGTKVLYCPAALTEPLVIPEGVTDIGNAFSDCHSLTFLTFPASLTEMDVSQFSRATQLEGVAVAPGNPVYSTENNILIRNGNELAMCPGGQHEVRLPDSITSVPAGILPNSYSMELYANGPRIRFEKGAFSFTQDARIHTGPGTILEYIDPADLAGGGIGSFDIQHPGPYYASVDGMLTSPDRKTLLAVPAGQRGRDALRVPVTVDTIASGAFTNCFANEVVMEHVKSIQSDAFRNCSISSIYISDELTQLGEYIYRDPSGGWHGRPQPLNIWFEGDQAAWDAIPNSDKLYNPEDKPTSPENPDYPGQGGYPGEHFPPAVPFTVQVHCNARKLTLTDCRAQDASYACAGDTVTLIASSDKPILSWKLTPAVEYTTGRTEHNQPCITFTMPSSDLKASPVFQLTEDISIQEAEMTIPLPAAGQSPADASVSPNAHYTASTGWYLAEGREDYWDHSISYYKGDALTGPFAADTFYIAEITLTAKEGYSFGYKSNNKYHVSVNGEAPYLFSADGTELVVTYLYRPLYPVTVVNGLSNGKNMTYDPATNSSTAYFADDETIRTWPVFKEGWTYGSMLKRGFSEQGSKPGYGIYEEYFSPFDHTKDTTIEYHPNKDGLRDENCRLVHVLHGTPYPGVLSSTSGVNHEDEHLPGSKVTLEAGTYPYPGYHFDHWVVYDSFNPNMSGMNPDAQTPSPSNVVLHDPNAQLTWFTMPDHEIFVEAVFTSYRSSRYHLNLEGGTIVSSTDPDAEQPYDYAWNILPGSSVTIRPNTTATSKFHSWTPAHGDVVVTDNGDGTYTLTMPNHDTTVYASFTDVTLYPVKIVGGTAHDVTGAVATSAGAGAELFLKPADPETFDGWEVVRGGVQLQENDTGFRFTMSTAEVEIRAKTHVHTFGPWQMTENGGHTRSCSCGHVETAPHSYTDWSVSEDGETLFRLCTVCGHRDEKPVEKTEHTHTHDDVWHTDAVGHWHVCLDQDCQAQFDYAQHSFGAWSDTDPATGRKTRSCACGYVETAYEPIASLPAPDESSTRVVPEAFTGTEPVSVPAGDGAVSYDSQAVQAIESALQAAGTSVNSVQLNLEKVTNVHNPKITPDQQKAIHKAAGGEVYSITLECLDAAQNLIQEISSFGEGTCAIRVPAPGWLKPGSSIQVSRVEMDGSLTDMKDVRLVRENSQWYVVWFSDSHSLYLLSDLDLYGKKHLTDSGEQQAYDLIDRGIAKGDGMIDLSACDLAPSALTKVMELYRNDHPEHYSLMGGFRYGLYPSLGTVAAVAPNYLSDTNELNDSMFRSRAGKLLAPASSMTTDYDKALAIHDALVRHVEYDLNAPHAHSAYGAIAEGRAVCEGYARAYQYLLQQVGIQSYVVTGTAGGGGHAWNLVRLNGKYYYTDTTWDDPTMSGMTESSKPVFYGYFNLPESGITADHSFDTLYRSIKPTANDDNMQYEGYAHTDSLNADTIANKLFKLNDEGTELVSRVYYTGSDANQWLSSTGCTSIAEAARFKGGYSASWITCGSEIYLNYHVANGQPFRPLEGQLTKPAPERPVPGKFAQPMTNRASELTDGITLKLEENVQGGLCVAAIFDGSGRQLAVGTVNISSGSASATIKCSSFDPDQAKTLKLFLLGSVNGDPLEKMVRETLVK